ncbi:hypothetical protein FRC01_000402 [Tulasnella sp. 417]|nr:hypothetical protein FRC01_000402 [Tulasnella sp. 417]
MSLSGYLYIKEWGAAQAAWDDDAERRPSIDRILESLELRDNPPRYLKARIKVVCDRMPECSGYVSRSLDEVIGSQQVTRDVKESLVIAWDLDCSSNQLVHMLNSNEDHDLLALQFSQYSPDYFNDKHLYVAQASGSIIVPEKGYHLPHRWAAFTAANGIQDNYSTAWTTFASGLDLLPLWSCSEKWELTPHALGGVETSFS